jgi:hypothetical protein
MALVLKSRARALKPQPVDLLIKKIYDAPLEIQKKGKML